MYREREVIIIEIVNPVLIPELKTMRNQIVNGPGLVVIRLGRCRVVESRNPKWYRELCAGFTSSHPNAKKRLARCSKEKFIPSKITVVKRQDVIKILTHMIEKGNTKSQKGEWMIEEAKIRLENQNVLTDEYLRD